MRIINGVAIKFRTERRIARHVSSEHNKDVVILQEDIATINKRCTSIRSLRCKKIFRCQIDRNPLYFGLLARSIEKSIAIRNIVTNVTTNGHSHQLHLPHVHK